MRLGDQILDDVPDMMLKPWMVENGNGWILCLMCPMEKWTERSGRYYRGIRHARKSRNQMARWMRAHRRCGFEGLME